MKKLLLVVCSLFIAAMFTGCPEKGKSASQNKSQTIIKSVDGSQKVDLTGTWMAKHDKYTFKMIFGSDGSFTYGCGGGSRGGPEQLSVDSDGGLRVDKEFNRWWYKGTYKTSGNVLITTCDELKDYSGDLSMKKGETCNFVISIVDDNELVIQTSGTGSTRTYKRQ